MADLKITELASLAGADLAAGDQLAIADSSASETKRITVTDLVGNATTLIADATIPGAKILFGSQEIAGTALANGAVDTTQIADDAITAAKIGDESTVDLVTTLPASGAFVGQIALDTDSDNKIYIWDGSIWRVVKASGSANTFVGSTTGIVNIDITVSGDEVTIATSLDDTTAAKHFLAGPTGSAGAVTYRAIAGTDLPIASASQRGGIQVSGDGLRMDTGKIEIDNDITAETVEYHLTQYDAKGLVTGGRVITATDLPEAGASTKGAVFPGSGLEVAAGGELNHTNSATPGDYAKVVVDAQGHVTGGTTLAESDIPSLDASKIASGALPSARIEDNAVTGAKVGDYAVSKFGEIQPTADHIGQFFFNPLTRDLFLWDGNVFQPVGISAGEIVLAGTYDASSNLLDSVTAEGSAAGFTNGASLPAADTGNNRYYVVVSQSGTGTAPAPTVTLEPPDILLSNGTSYVLIETSETITAQIASNVGFTPYGDIASTNVQGAIAELDDEKVSLAGDTMTGDLTLGAGVDLVYEGTSDNAFETTLTVADPTADNTVTIPNETGTVVTTGSSGVVTSTMITDGTIVNADISSSAEIAVSKLADGAARQLLQTNAAGTGVEWASDIDIPGTLDVAGATVLDGSLDVDSGTLHVDATNNSVGVRTNAPGAHLHIGVADAKIRLGQTTSSAYTEIYRDSTSGFTVYDAAQADPSRAHVFQLGGTDAFRINSDGKVAVGTSTPDALFTVAGVGAFGGGTAGAPSVAFSGDLDTGLYSPGANQVAISTNGTGRLFVDANGRVGVGATPDTTLTINSGVIDTTVHVVSSDSNVRIKLTDGDATNSVFIAGKGDNLAFETAGNNERLRITSNGNVGIGTNSPSQKLEVVSTIDTIARITSGDGRTAILDLGKASDPDGGRIAYDSGNNLLLYTNSNERARIDSSGNVGIGTSSPAEKLSILGSLPKLLIQDSQTSLTTANPIIRFAESSTGNVLDNYWDIGPKPLTSNNFAFNIGTNGTSSYFNIRFDTGNVGIGTVSPAEKLEVAENISCESLYVTSGGDTAGAGISGEFAHGGINSKSLIIGADPNNVGSNTRLQFNVDGSERMRIDSSGRLLVGTSSPSIGQYSLLSVNSTSPANVVSISRQVDDATGPRLYLTKTRGSETAIVNNQDVIGAINFNASDGVDINSAAASIYAQVDGTPGADDMPGRLVFSTTADGASSPTERMRINNNGDTDIGGYATDGGTLTVSKASSWVVTVNRVTDDGDLVRFRQGGTTEGTISVSGTTVSYNGAHLSRWSQLPGGIERTEILRGTVLSNIDEMCEWGEEDNEQLNRMQVSDVEGDRNVAGVFQAWDNDDDIYTDDFYCAMTGDFVIRIGAGVTVSRGDLLMSAGDGTAKPQDDDIIRSKTVAKVTSTHVSETYADGSYCVPCVLMAC